mgnify:CR=1 FL=1
MYGLRRFGIKLGLDKMQNILGDLGNPHNQYPCIHIAGTNGKGSVAASLSAILHAAGYRVGLFTSPHLVKFNERICINSRQISDEQVVNAYEAVKTAGNAEREATFFEISAAMALYEFARQQVDWAIVETGMGGRLDATNVVQPAVSIITNISIEHKEYLGNTLAKIAAEKAGIIKSGVPVVTGVEQKSARAVLETVANQKEAPLYRMGEAFRTRRTSDRENRFTYFGTRHIWRNMKTRLIGDHQVKNAAIALAACETLMASQAVRLTEPVIRDGLLATRWPGRLEIVSRQPLVILDGAHNLMAARNLGQFLRNSDILAGREVTLVIGILDDKPWEAMLQSLVPPCKRVILTQPEIDRALPAETLLPVVKKMAATVEIIPDVAEAVRRAIKTTADDAAVCVAGSLYVVGEARDMLEQDGRLPR